jgi:hypothetical protein
VTGYVLAKDAWGHQNTAHRGGSLKNAGSCGMAAGPSKWNSRISLQACRKMYCATQQRSR